jgi:carbon-monoxide dehydrogenase small subunit
MVKCPVKLKVNGDEFELYVEPQRTLLEVLREDLGLTGTKYSCGAGECGACTVLLDGESIVSCMTLAVEADGKSVETIEGMAKGGELHPIQEAFLEHGAIQCGFCTPGMVMQAKALLDENLNPTEEEIKQYMRGNLCRCGTYPRMVKAIIAAAEKMKKLRGR